MSDYPRFPTPTERRFFPDRFVGFGYLVYAVWSLLRFFYDLFVQRTRDQAGFDAWFQHEWGILLATAVLTIAYGGVFVGVAQSRRPAFWATLTISGLMFAGAAWKGSLVILIGQLALWIYSLCRLTRVLGPATSKISLE